MNQVSFSLRPTLSWALWLGLATSAQSADFGFDGQRGKPGYTGNRGLDGQSVSVKADGTPVQLELSGKDGTNGGVGQDGYHATNCNQPIGVSRNLRGAEGGDGGHGGSGGGGGHGGSITVYFEAQEQIHNVYVRSIAGRGGRGAWGGRPGQGCRCSQPHWTVPAPGGGTPGSYYCTNGNSGRNGLTGQNGTSGAQGRVTLIPQFTPVLPENPTQLIDMLSLDKQSYLLSQNKWETRQGAKLLFAPGSIISDTYTYYVGRNEAKVRLVWAAKRPLADFKNYKVRLNLDGATAKLAFPNGFWTETDTSIIQGEQVITIKAVVANSELGALSFERFKGVGADHVIDVKDSGGQADVLMNSVKLQYFLSVNGQYQKKFDAVVPPEALEVSANRLTIKMNSLGLDPTLFKQNTSAYAGIVVTRKLAEQSVSYQLANYYVIKDTLEVDDRVLVLQDTSLMIGNQVVGSVKKGEQYLVQKISGDWIALKKLDQTPISGWVMADKLQRLKM